MGRNDIMMTGRRRSGWRYLFFALGVFAIVYVAHEAFFRRSQAPPPASIPTVGDTVEKAYNTLEGSFRERVPLAEFAAMFHRMADPDCGGELPEIRQASVADGTGPEPPVARLRVEYPNAKVRAEYHFARIDGIWQLQSFSRVPGELHTAQKQVGRPIPAGPDASTQDAGKSTPGQRTGKGAATPNPAPGRPTTPCDYIIQPGDTLGAISLHFYGTTRYWRRILEANPGLSERNLRIGRRIRIPSSPEPLPPREETEDEPKAAPPTP